MHDDEQAIRDLIGKWSRATAAGDISELIALMADDAIFLTPGQAPMRSDEFAASFLSVIEHVRIEAASNIQEIQVSRDWAYCWNYIDVCVTPRAGGSPKTRSGHTLTIFRKQNGSWVLARDANMLA